jgi:hypothetical protein
MIGQLGLLHGIRLGQITWPSKHSPLVLSRRDLELMIYSEEQCRVGSDEFFEHLKKVEPGLYDYWVQTVCPICRYC